MTFYSPESIQVNGAPLVVLAGDEDRAGSVSDDALGVAAEQDALDSVLSPAADHYKLRADLIAQAYDLPIRPAHPEMRPRHVAAEREDFLNLRVEDLLGFAL